MKSSFGKHITRPLLRNLVGRDKNNTSKFVTAGEISENIAINVTNIDQYHGPAGQKVFNSQADSI